MGLKILGVSGSLRDKSYGLRAISHALKAAEQFDAETRILNLRDAQLPMYNPDGPNDDPRILKVREDVSWAEAFILCSPDYHGSMSGAVKNFMDYHWSEFSGKLFGYICASDEKGLTVMEQMRTAVRQCYGWSMPYGVSIHGKSDFDADGNLRTPQLESRLRMVGRDLAIYGRLIRTQFLDDIARRTPETFAAKYV